MSTTKSVIITCAGIGSRLGLGNTKALINIHGKSLIAWQLELLKDIDDIRIVIGYQANDIIKEVKKYRNDVIFIYNHNYFTTKTGYSYFLGAKDGNDYAIELDGDLLIHPDDMNFLLRQNGEWIAYAEKRSNDAIYCDIDPLNNDIISFSKTKGQFEWTGPCCIHKNKLCPNKENVFNQLEPYLPMKGYKVRACDIDTYEDYQNALNFIKGWYKQ
ncbi:NTP transferase domain-containing protein [Campylobacter lari]|nr:NTP transferase domain-containing protein [Campylobacter lari]